MAVGPDNMVHLLWNHAPDSQMSLGTINNSTHAYSSANYGPYPGWSVAGLTVDASSTMHVLWNNTNGQVSLWNMADANPSATCFVYGPFPGVTAKSIAAGPSGTSQIHIQWSRFDGAGVLWVVNANGTYNASPVFGPYPNWRPIRITVDAGNEAHLLWSRATGATDLWNVDADNATHSSTPLSVIPPLLAGTGATFGYTGDGLRAWKQTSGGIRTYYLGDGSDPVCELTASGTVQAVNTFGATGLLSRRVTAGNASSFI